MVKKKKKKDTHTATLTLFSILLIFGCLTYSTTPVLGAFGESGWCAAKGGAAEKQMRL